MPALPGLPNDSVWGWVSARSGRRLRARILRIRFRLSAMRRLMRFLLRTSVPYHLRDHGTAWAEKAVEMIGADAIAIHLNFLQEAIQPEGDHNATGCLAAIAALCAEIKPPVIVKETGCGISKEVARQCWGAGAGPSISAAGVAPRGRQSRASVPTRVGMHRTSASRHLARTLPVWGIPTAVSLAEVAGTGSPVIASGGIRNGIDMAKSLALGADLCGMALPLLKPALESDEALACRVETVHRELVGSMFLCGAARVRDLRKARLYITGKTRQMMDDGNPRVMQD